MAEDEAPPEDNVVDLAAKRDQLKRDLESGNIALATNESQDYLKLLNLGHAFICSYFGKPMVMSYTYKHVYERTVVEFITPESFAMLYGDKVVREGRKEIELGRWWIKNPQRRQYHTVIFDPDLPKEYTPKGGSVCYNLWEGLTVVPTRGDWKCILKHIYRILCNSDDSKFNYVVKWLAWMMQNPGKRAETILIFKGKEGAGKGFIFSSFVKIFGEHGYHASNKEKLVGRFNEHLGSTVFLFADEADLAGDKDAEGALKMLITESVIPVEGKFKSVTMVKNCLHIVMSTNQKWVIPAHEDSRRYFINEVDNKYAKNHIADSTRDTYFKKLLNCLDSGGRSAMVHDLRQMRLEGWHPRENMPMTSEMQKQVNYTLPKVSKFMLTFINEGMFPGERAVNGEYIVKSKLLFDYIDNLEPGNKLLRLRDKGEVLRELKVKRLHRKEGNYWVFPSLSELRKKWDDKYGKYDWDDDAGEWRFDNTSY